MFSYLFGESLVPFRRKGYRDYLSRESHSRESHSRESHFRKSHFRGGHSRESLFRDYLFKLQGVFVVWGTKPSFSGIILSGYKTLPFICA